MCQLERLVLHQLDRAVRLPSPSVPPRGWLNRVRRALGLSQAQAAHRLAISQQSWDRMEKREVAGKVTLETIQEAARAMHSRLVYFLVFMHDASFEDLLKRRAREAANRLVSRVDRHMTIEDQQLSMEKLNEEIADVAAELFRTFAELV